MSEQTDRITVLEGRAEVPYNYKKGYDYGRFFDELANNGRVMGRRCANCDTVLVPPRSFCGDCYQETREWVEVGPTAEVLGYGVVHQEVPGQPEEPPYIYIEATFHGADTKFPHILGGHDMAQLREATAVGMDVEPVFKPADDRTGSWDDIDYFRPVEE